LFYFYKVSFDKLVLTKICLHLIELFVTPSKLSSCQFALHTAGRYCRWWGILYSSARNCCLAFW